MGTHVRRISKRTGSKCSDSTLICAVADRLDEARVSKNMKIEELAYKSGVPEREVARLLQREVNPRISTVAVLAQALGLDMRSLLGCKETEASDNNSEFASLLRAADHDMQRAVLSILRC